MVATYSTIPATIMKLSVQKPQQKIMKIMPFPCTGSKDIGLHLSINTIMTSQLKMMRLTLVSPITRSYCHNIANIWIDSEKLNSWK